MRELNTAFDAVIGRFFPCGKLSKSDSSAQGYRAKGAAPPVVRVVRVGEGIFPKSSPELSC